MHVRLASFVCAAVLAGAGVTAAAAQPQQAPGAAGQDEALVAAFDNVSRSTAWTRTDTINLDFSVCAPARSPLMLLKIPSTDLAVLSTKGLGIPATTQSAMRFIS